MGSIVPSTPIASAVEAQPDELWILTYMLLTNWAPGVTLSQSFRTDIGSAKSLAESRIGLVQRPYRTISFTLLGLAPEDALRLEMVIARAAHAKSMIPLYCDVTKLTASYSSPSTVLTCDPSNRRFKVGGKIVVAKPERHAADMPTFEIATVASIGASQINISTGLAGNFPIGTKIYPIIEAQVALSHSVIAITDKVARAQLTFLEVKGNAALPELEVAGVNPSGFPTHDDGGGQGAIPIMDRQLQWFGDIQTGIVRSGGFTSIGRDSSLQVFGARGQFTRSLPFRALNRTDAFDLIRFFESRAGQLHPFWLPSPFSEYDADLITANTVRVTAVGEQFDWIFFRPNIAIVMRDGTVHIRGVAFVSRSAGKDTVTFDSALPLAPTLSDVRRVCMVHKVRFSLDEMTENWITDEVMDSAIPVIELLEEKDIDIADLLTIPELAIPGAACTNDACCCDTGGGICCELTVFPKLDCFVSPAPCNEAGGGPFFDCCTDNVSMPCIDECGNAPFDETCDATSVDTLSCNCTSDKCQGETDGCDYDAGPSNGCLGFECSPCP